MFSFGRVRRSARFSRLLRACVLIAACTAIIENSAQAQQVRTGGCIGDWKTLNCVTRWVPGGDPYVRIIPPPSDGAAGARASERERRWADRCRPAIRQDRYGVARYYYALPGCEFGVGEY